MRDIWSIGPTAATRALRACGVSPRQAERLVALKLQFDRSALLELTAARNRLLFVRWLVESGRLDDGLSISRVGTALVIGHRPSPPPGD